MQKLRSTSASKQARAAFEISCIMTEICPTNTDVELEERFITARPIPALVAAGAIPAALVHLLESSSVFKVQHPAAIALMTFSFWDGYRTMIAEAGGVPALVKLVQSGRQPLQGPAVTALLNVILTCDGGSTLQATLEQPLRQRYPPLSRCCALTQKLCTGRLRCIFWRLWFPWMATAAPMWPRPFL